MAFVVFAACAGAPPRLPPAPAPPAADPEVSLYLLGDAGLPDPGGDPVLTALTRELSGDVGSAERLIVFLGDNVYPRGLPVREADDRAEAERRLRTQMRVATETSTPAVFVPGNHDWDFSGRAGWEAVRRQGAFLREQGEGLTEMAPADGCPGPALRDVGERLRLVFLDTEWWLREEGKPMHPTSSCTHDSKAEILASLGQAVDQADGRHVVVAAHHPLQTGGPHGGYFTLRDHLFPLRDWKSWLWLPLPVVGSLYPIARQNGLTDQDVSGDRNAAMRAAIDSTLSAHPVLIWANGHTHGLEVLDGGGRADLLVSSGVGNYGHVTPLRAIERSLFLADGASGFMKLEIEPSGRARLGVTEVDESGGRRETYSVWLDPPDR